MNALRVIIMAVAVTVLAMPARAQQGPPPGGPPGDDMEYDAGPGRGGPPPAERRDEVRKKIEAVRIYRLTEELKLDSKESAKLAALLGSLDQKRAQAQRESIAAMTELQDALRSAAPDERKLKPLIDKIERHHRELMNLRDEELSGVRGILTVEQQARYILFQRDFMREMRGMIAGARGQQGQGTRGGPGPGAGQGRFNRPPQ